MSDAIRCEACRWWADIDAAAENGTCELDPPQFRGGNPFDADNWFQPQTESSQGCSRGEPKTQKTGDE